MANIVEIFSSIQGEGLYIGTRQVFVRFAGCNMACAYCDTPESRTFGKEALIESTPGRRDFSKITNPLSIECLAQHINSLLTLRHHSISFTGGEPLFQVDTLVELAAKLDAPKYLETNGILVEQLTKILPQLDIISMDIKLPSIAGKEYWQEHHEFLRLASTKEVFVKIVVTGQSSKNELQQAFELVTSINKSIPVILQPVTPLNGCEPVFPADMLLYQEQALSVLNNVRVIPQTHKFMGQL